MTTWYVRPKDASSPFPTCANGHAMTVMAQGTEVEDDPHIAGYTVYITCSDVAGAPDGESIPCPICGATIDLAGTLLDPARETS